MLSAMTTETRLIARIHTKAESQERPVSPRADSTAQFLFNIRSLSAKHQSVATENYGRLYRSVTGHQHYHQTKVGENLRNSLEINKTSKGVIPNPFQDETTSLVFWAYGFVARSLQTACGYAPRQRRKILRALVSS